MVKKYFFWFCVFAFSVFIILLNPVSAESIHAGVAAAVKGQVFVTPESAAAHLLKSGDKVFMGDQIETGKDGQLQVLLLDQTVFTLGPLSALKMDEFTYNPSDDSGKVKASMVKGVFRVVSGKVAHKKPDNMTVNLPAGTIGFRGTNVAGLIDGQKTLVVLLGPVGAGRIYVTNTVNGEVIGVDINEAGQATIIGGPNTAPVPVFQVSEADLNRITQALGQPASGNQVTATGGSAGGARSSLSVNTQALQDLLSTLDQANQQTREAAQDAAKSSTDSGHSSHGSGSGQQGHYTSP